MSEPGELTAAQLTELAADLAQLREELMAQLARAGDHSAVVELDQQLVGRLSRMDAMQQQELVKANRRQHEVRLKQVIAALHRIDEGSFGECRRCEEPIGVSRVEARPEAPFCLDCQEEIDAAR